MGGISTRGLNGWEIGVYGCQITAKGRDVFLGPDHVLEHSDRLVRRASFASQKTLTN